MTDYFKFATLCFLNVIAGRMLGLPVYFITVALIFVVYAILSIVEKKL